MSDQLDPTELHEFAAEIGLRRSWFQRGKRLGRPTEHDPAGDHYDVTEGKRWAAVRAGAVEIDQDGLVELMRKRRDLAQAARHLRQVQGALRVGEIVITPSGLRGTVVDASCEHTVDLEVVPGVVSTWLRAAVRDSGLGDGSDSAGRGDGLERPDPG
jgi:preprotein translocase subunit YajC